MIWGEAIVFLPQASASWIDQVRCNVCSSVEQAFHSCKMHHEKRAPVFL